MKKNIGDIDAYIRITGGLSMVGLGIVKSSSSMLLLGSMKVAEGIIRYCPVMDLLGVSTIADKIKHNENIIVDSPEGTE